MIRITDERNDMCASCGAKEGLKAVFIGINRKEDGIREIKVTLCEHCLSLLAAEISDELNGYVFNPKEKSHEE
ncbi:hypothetical protein [uncultured Dialister sp.]|uniref:hypothetical protein n=1 Tax=Dialister succinatiphilus TaxID=487173 RepID=UPI00266FA4C3|nr:hypothetical protein [uncultured Dialister sp.]